MANDIWAILFGRCTSDFREFHGMDGRHEQNCKENIDGERGRTNHDGGMRRKECSTEDYDVKQDVY